MRSFSYIFSIAVLSLLCSCGNQLEDAADKASQNLAQGLERGLKGINTDILKIDTNIKNAVALDRLQRGEESIIVQVTECVGSFKIEGSFHTESTEDRIWVIRVSDILESGARPVPPAAPDPKKLQAFAYVFAKKNYDERRAAYNRAAAQWEEQFGRKLVDNGIDVAPNFAGPGLYAFRVTITPETETKENWKFRLNARVVSLDGKSKQFKVFAIEKRDMPNHPLGQNLPPHLLVFNAQ